MRKLFFILLALAVGCAVCATARKSNWDDDARRRKAAYVYLQAVDAFLEENYNLYGQLLDKASRLDPDDPELQARVGEWKVLTASNDSAALESGFALMFDAYNQNPSDYFEGMQLLNMTSNYRRWNDNLRAAEMMASEFPSRNEVNYQLSRSYLIKALMGDTAYVGKTLAVLSDLENKIGKSAQLSDMKIRAYASVHDTAAIVSELATLNAASPADPYTAMAIGQVFNTIDMPDSALHYLSRACELDSTNGTAIMIRAQFYNEQGDSLAYERETLRAIKSPDLDFEAKARFVVNYITEHLNDSTGQARIDSLFETLLDVHSGEPEVYRLYGGYLDHIGKHVQAADQMSYVVSLQPAERDNWIILSQMYLNANEIGKAADALESGRRYFPNDMVFVRYEAAYRSLTDDDEKAIALLESYPDSTITDADELSDFKTLLGDLYYKTNRPYEAFEVYEDALKYNPFNYMAMNNVAYFYAESDTLLDRAESYARRAVRHDPENTTFIDTYAWVLYKKGDYQAARQEIDKCLELYRLEAAMDSLDTTMDNIALADDTSATHVETPVEVVEEAIEEVEDNIVGSAEIYNHAGDIYYRCGDQAKAIEFWEEALKRDPDDADAIQEKIKHKKIIDKNAP